jgi:hypothetical protein
MKEGIERLARVLNGTLDCAPWKQVLETELGEFK